MNIVFASIIGAFVLAGLVGILRAIARKRPDATPTPAEEWEVRQW